MAAEYVLQINSERLRIEDRKTKSCLEFPNRVVVNKRRGLILALGEDVETVRARFADRLGKDEIAALTLFGADASHLAYEIRVIGHLTRLLARQSQDGGTVSLVPVKPAKGADYFIELPGYETLPRARKLAFEHALQAYFRVRRLVINGEELAITARKRELEIQVRRLFVRGLPGIAAIIGYLAAPAALRAERFAFVAYVLLILLLFYYGGRIVWMILARHIVPVDYCLYMLRNTRGRFSPIDQWLARTLWGGSTRG